MNKPYRTRPADDGGVYFLSGGDTPTAAVMDRDPRRIVIHRGRVVAQDDELT